MVDQVVSLEIVDASVLVGIVHVLRQLTCLPLNLKILSKFWLSSLEIIVADHLVLQLMVILLGGEQGRVLVEPAVHVGLPVALVGQHVPAGIGKGSISWDWRVDLTWGQIGKSCGWERCERTGSTPSNPPGPESGLLLPGSWSSPFVRI